LGLLELIITIALVGLVVWAITSLIPMDAKFQQIIYVVAIIFIIVFVLNALGLFHGLHDIRLNR
jgi:sulfite exporter TauE/SafE